jgi:hypothetical protein
MALGDGLINDRTRHSDAAPTNVLGIEQIGFNEISEGWAGMGRDIANGLSGLPEYAEAQKFLPSVTIGNFAAIQQMFPQEGSGQAQPNKSAADEMLAMASDGVDGAFKNTNRTNRFMA